MKSVFLLVLLPVIAYVTLQFFIPDEPFPDRLASIPNNASYIDNELYDQPDNANQWFDPDGFARGLHVLNLARIHYFYNVIQNHWESGLEERNGLIHVLDVGCGGGIGTEKLFFKDFVEYGSDNGQQYKARLGLNITGVEPSKRSVQIANTHFQSTDLFKQLQQQRSNNKTVPSLQYIVGSAYDLSAFPDESVDVFISSDVMDHLFDLRKAMREVNRVLKKKTGLFIFETINRTYRSFLWVQRLAELFQLVPHGTHDSRLFVTIDELYRLVREESDARIEIQEVKGICVSVGLDLRSIELQFWSKKWNLYYPWPGMKSATDRKSVV